MRILFCVFSGTGNTTKVAGEIATRLDALGHETDVRMIGGGAIDPSRADVVVFCYPVHAFNAPRPMLNFIKSLGRLDGKRAYIVHTSGEALKLNDAAGITPRRLLKKRGYSVLGEYTFVMPYNIIFRHSDEMAARMWQSAQRRATSVASDIASLNKRKIKVNAFKRAVSFTLKIEHVAMPKIGKRFTTLSDCSGCGRCASLCPVGNIVMERGKPKFGAGCAGCMACSFGCPHDAVRISLLNGWRVNGRYTFEGRPASDDEVCSYCRKSYIRYFKENEE